MSETHDIIKQYVRDSLLLLHQAGIVFPKKAKVSIYHHAGLKSIYETGAMFLNIVDRDYSKSYVVMQKGQHYPNHYHKIKTESMYVLYGELILQLGGTEHRLQPGEILHIERGQDHSFFTENGTVFEELSTAYVPNDSVYMDDAIREAGYSFRRTILSEKQWEEAIKTCFK